MSYSNLVVEIFQLGRLDSDEKNIPSYPHNYLPLLSNTAS